ISDDALLQAAKLLDQYHCDFDGGLIVNLAPRRLPKTLAFLASKKIAADLDLALKSVVRGDDLETIQVLLDAGADPLAGVALSSALSDAAWAGRTASVSAMLKAVKDKAAPKVITAYEGALRKGFAETAQAFVDGGVRPPPVVVPTSSPCEAKELTAEQRRLLARLSLPNANGLAGLAGNMSCKLIQECHDLVLIDCNSAADGPAYYIDQKTPKILATCGGACMRGCTGCPPKQWDCSCLR
ncbi:MAG: hypothetical protein HY075_04300, partial [Deltaproteobacteria bacterium]|nr:hypothetical protein [Deltaproteobacteria bacterium]